MNSKLFLPVMKMTLQVGKKTRQYGVDILFSVGPVLAIYGMMDDVHQFITTDGLWYPLGKIDVGWQYASNGIYLAWGIAAALTFFGLLIGMWLGLDKRIKLAYRAINGAFSLSVIYFVLMPYLE